MKFVEFCCGIVPTAAHSQQVCEESFSRPVRDVARPSLPGGVAMGRESQAGGCVQEFPAHGWKLRGVAQTKVARQGRRGEGEIGKRI